MSVCRMCRKPGGKCSNCGGVADESECPNYGYDGAGDHQHDSCIDEWNRRSDNGLCVKCSKPSLDCYCSSCGYDGGQFTGYPGP